MAEASAGGGKEVYERDVALEKPLLPTKTLQLLLQRLPIGTVFESFLTLLVFQRQSECRDVIRDRVLDQSTRRYRYLRESRIRHPDL
jgi:hypothetical protein